MDAAIINPFVVAAIDVLRGEIGGPISRGSPRLEDSPLVSQDVSVLIALIGQVQGLVLMGMSHETALRVASQMVGGEVGTLDDLSRSALAELTNIVSGRASMDLEQGGRSCNISAPTVVTDQGFVISETNLPRVIVPLQTRCGDIVLQLAVEHRIGT